MPKSYIRKNANEKLETEKVPILVIKKIREAILDEILKPGDRLREVELAKKFEVSRSPVREALLALEKGGTVVMSPYKGAILKPLSAEEVLQIAELRLALVSLAIKPAHRRLSPADFDHAYEIAKQVSGARDAKRYSEFNGRFWNVILEKADRPILWEIFVQLDVRIARYYPILFRFYQTAARRPCFQELFIESYRLGQFNDALGILRKIDREMTTRVIGHLGTTEYGNGVDEKER
jgi:DNA-binding GntR family transcriptional regulator